MSASAGAFPTIGLVGRHATPGIAEPLTRLAKFLTARGHRVLVDADTASSTPIDACKTAPSSELGRDASLVVVIGGDGTLLAIARKLARFDVPLIGVNQGRLGFLTDVPLSEMETVLATMLDGGYVEEARTMLHATLTPAAGDGESTEALNDVVVSRGAQGGMMDCAVAVDGRFVYAMRADGLIVATPTGSTAYALSAQGPIVDPAVPAFLLVPVAPHALSNRPTVVRDSAVIEIALLGGKNVSLNCDGQANFPLSEGDRVVIRRAAHGVRLLHPKDHDHFAMLRRKLHWGETAEALRIASP
jgi:NAD+ kinase